MNFVKFSKTPFLKNISERLILNPVVWAVILYVKVCKTFNPYLACTNVLHSNKNQSLDCSVNQLTGFYMKVTWTWYRLNVNKFCRNESLHICTSLFCAISDLSQKGFAYSKSIMETSEQWVKCVQSGLYQNYAIDVILVFLLLTLLLWTK